MRIQPNSYEPHFSEQISEIRGEKLHCLLLKKGSRDADLYKKRIVGRFRGCYHLKKEQTILENVSFKGERSIIFHRLAYSLQSPGQFPIPGSLFPGLNFFSSFSAVEVVFTVCVRHISAILYLFSPVSTLDQSSHWGEGRIFDGGVC